MQVIVIKDMSAGNDSVGEMWQETKIFDAKDTLNTVLQWASGGHPNHNGFVHEDYTRKRITITVPCDQKDYIVSVDKKG